MFLNCCRIRTKAIRFICLTLSLTLILGAIPVSLKDRKARAQTTTEIGQSRQLPPYTDLPDINALVNEGKNPKPAKPQPPLKESTLCGYRDKACKAKQQKEKKIGQRSVPSGDQSLEHSASATKSDKRGWLSRFGRAVAGTLGSLTSGLTAFPARGNGFLAADSGHQILRHSSASVSTVAAPVTPPPPPPPPSFSSLEQAKLDPRYGAGSPGEDLFSGNYNFSLPLVSLPGRNGLDLNLALSYNSLVWIRYGNMVSFDYDYYASLTPGFRLGFPEIEGLYVVNGANTWIATLPSGRRVELRQVATNKFEATDSSYLYLDTTNPNLITLYATDGTQFRFEPPVSGWNPRCTQIRDSNGNYITITYKLIGVSPDQLLVTDKVTDTLGRQIVFNYDANLHLQTITQQWQGQTFTWAQFDYGTLTIQTNFSGLVVDGPANNTTIPVITRVITGDGARTTLVHNSWGQISQIWNHGEADNQRAAMIYVFPGTSSPQTDCPRFTQRNDGIYSWGGQTYDPNTGFGWVSTYFYFPADETQGWVTPPDGVTHKEFFSTTGGTRGLTTRMETWYSNQLQKFTDLTWVSDSTSSPPLRPRVTETKVTDDLNHNGTYESGTDKRSRTTISYTTLASTVKLPWIVKEYNADATTVYRSTQTDYVTSTNYTGNNRRIIGLPTNQYLYQGDAESGGTLMAQTGFVYDSPNDTTTYLQAHATTPSQHDSASYGTGFLYRGNPTKTLRYSVTSGVAGSYLETKTGYYTTGAVALTKDALGHQTSLYYDDSFLHITEPSPGTLSTTTITRNPPTFAYPTRITDPDGFSSTVAYNYDFGAVTRTVDPKEYALHGASPATMAVSTYDTKGRPDKALVWKDGAKYSQTRYAYGTDHNWTQIWTTVNSLSEETWVLSLLDGASRERITISEHPGSAGGLRSSYKVFDLVGRVTEWSRPTEINGYWAPSGDDTAYVITTQTYDWKSRPLVTTNPDNTTRQVGYTGCGCAGGDVITTTDEVGKKQELTRDVSGRVITTKLLRPDNSLYATTTRSYNVRDQVLSTKLYAGSGDGVSCPAGTCEETLTEYDGFGRLWKRRLPQYQASTLDPNFTASTTPYDLYEYNADDTLWKVTDPRTASVTYGYNNRGQVTSLSYGVPAGVASTPNVTFGYDAAGRRLWMDDGPGRVDYVYDTLNRLITEKRKFDEFSCQRKTKS